MAKSSFVYVTYIRSTPQKIWDAITTPEFTRQFWFGMHLASEWKAGSSWEMVHSDGRVADRGEVLESQPPHRLVLRWRNVWKPEFAAEGDALCTITLEPNDGAVKVQIVHEIEREPSGLIGAVSNGWPRIMANLKSLLETGRTVFDGTTH